MAPSSDSSFHFSFSLAVLGESRVGKSKLISCTLPETLDDDAAPSELGVDHGIKCRAHTYESRGARYQILMWEVPGAPRYLDVAPRYASMAAGLLLVFDLTRRSTFERVSLWLEAVEAASPELPRVLVGNKSDGETQVSAEEAVALAQKYACKYFETSAIRNDQVPEAFSSLIARIVAQIPNPPEPSLLLRKRIQIGKSLYAAASRCAPSPRPPVCRLHGPAEPRTSPPPLQGREQELPCGAVRPRLVRRARSHRRGTTGQKVESSWRMQRALHKLVGDDPLAAPCVARLPAPTSRVRSAVPLSSRVPGGAHRRGSASMHGGCRVVKLRTTAAAGSSDQEVRLRASGRPLCV